MCLSGVSGYVNITPPIPLATVQAQLPATGQTQLPVNATVPVQTQLPVNLQAAVPRFAVPAPVPQPKRRQQQLPTHYQAAAPRRRQHMTINDGASSSSDNTSPMSVVIKRGIARRTCFAVEFIPTQQQHYLSVAAFITANADLLRSTLLQHVPRLYKLQMSVEAQFTLSTDQTQTKSWHLSTSAEKGNNDTLPDYFNDKATTLDDKISQYTHLGSGWKVVRVLKVSLVVSEFSELCRLSGHSFVPTPPIIAKKKCAIIVQNEDSLCFIYAIISILKRNVVDQRKQHKPAKYQRYLNELSFEAESMPMQLVNIPRFERKNPNLAINVIKFTPPLMQVGVRDVDDDDEEENVDVFKHPCLDLVYKSKQMGEGVQSIYLLLVEGKDTVHYMGVTSLERLLNCNRNSVCNVQIRNKICYSCLRLFRSQATLDKHKPLCDDLQVFGTVYTTPAKADLKFDQWQKTISPKFIVYADFQSS